MPDTYDIEYQGSTYTIESDHALTQAELDKYARMVKSGNFSDPNLSTPAGNGKGTAPSSTKQPPPLKGTIKGTGDQRKIESGFEPVEIASLPKMELKPSGMGIGNLRAIEAGIDRKAEAQKLQKQLEGLAKMQTAPRNALYAKNAAGRRKLLAEVQGLRSELGEGGEGQGINARETGTYARLVIQQDMARPKDDRDYWGTYPAIGSGGITDEELRVAKAILAKRAHNRQITEDYRERTQESLQKVFVEPVAKLGGAIGRHAADALTLGTIRLTPGAREAAGRFGENVANIANPAATGLAVETAAFKPGEAFIDTWYTGGKLLNATDENGKPISLADRVDAFFSVLGMAGTLEGLSLGFRGKKIGSRDTQVIVDRLAEKGATPEQITEALGPGGKPFVQKAIRGNKFETPKMEIDPQAGPIYEAVRPVGEEIGRAAAVEAPQAPKAAQRPAQAPETAPKPKEDAYATGLANQVQEREALRGIIDEIESTKGRTAEQWQEQGKQAFEAMGTTHADRMREARGLARRIAEGDEELTGLKVGILTEAKRNMLADIQAIERSYVDVSGVRDITELNKRLSAANDDLIQMLQDVQQGKGRWSDVGRALQMGSTINEGVFAEVIAQMERKGNPVSERMKAKLQETTRLVADRDARIADLETQLKAEQTAPSEKPYRKYDRKSIEKNLEDLYSQWNKAKSSNRPRAGGKQSGALQKVTAEDIKNLGERARIAKDIIKAHIDLHINAPLEEIIVSIQKTFADRLGIDIDRQAVIDLASEKGETRTRTEKAARRRELMSTLRRESTLVKDAAAEKARTANEAKAAKQKAERARRAAEQAERMVEEIEEQASKARRKQEAEDARANERTAWAAFKEQERIAEQAAKKAERTQKKIDDVKKEITDLKEQIENRRYRVPTKRERAISQELENLRAERQIYSKEVQAAMKAHDTPFHIKAARVIGGAVRGAKLGSDIGQTARQGLFGFGELRAYGKSFNEARKNVFSKKNMAKWEIASREKQIDGKYMEPIRQRATLSRTSTRLNPEELGIGSVLSKIPVVGGAFERWQHTFINTLRNEVFDASYIKGMNERELKQRAQFINNATGRGNINNIPEGLQLIMTSPRYEASRWGTIGEIVKNPLTVFDFKNKRLNRAAVANIKTMAQTAAGVYALMRIAETQGYVVDWDPDSSDFMKMRRYKGGKLEWDYTGPHYVGGTPTEEVWDMSAGLAPRMRDLFRTYFAFRQPDRAKNLTTIVGKAAARTASPGVTIPVEQGSYAYQRRQGVEEKDLKSPLSGWMPEEEAKGWWAIAPLVYVGFNQAGAGDAEKGDTAMFDEFNEGSALWAWAREFIGTGVSRYPAKVKRDGIGRARTEETRNDPVTRELARIKFEHKLSRNFGESDADLETRKQAFGDYVHKDIAAEIASEGYKGLTQIQKRDHIAMVLGKILKEFNEGNEAVQRAKESEREAKQKRIEAQEKAGVR